MGSTQSDLREIEALCLGLLHNAAARRQAAALVEPDSPSVDFRTGFAAGREAGEMAGLALALGALTGESPTGLVDEAVVSAAVDGVLPVDFHFDGSPGLPPAPGREVA
ncbi:MAG: hypothetical protein LC749_18755 [Actinobacteria bacterium]|nr:hypothetical protein [Actinomycetota bacterium]